MAAIIKYPVSTQDFPILRENGYLYVDKTRQIYNLINNARCVFLSRPRRFGKSLLVSTLQCLFEGRRELFKGLAIDSLDFDWTPRAVLRFDLSGMNYEDKPEALGSSLEFILSGMEKKYGSDPAETSLETRFAGIIQRAKEKTGRNVVILVDEYDKPILDNVHLDKNREKVRAELQGFYGVIKKCDGDIEFSMFTGVTKVTHVTIFSGLNNLQDISMNFRYFDICGFSETEFHDNFQESIRDFAEFNGETEEQTWELFKQMYDGYHFCVNTEGVYNPYSVLNAFNEMQTGSYWFTSGTPGFIAKLLQHNHYNLQNIETPRATPSQLRDLADFGKSIIPLLFQSGYLTIKSYDKLRQVYTLTFPNLEVKQGFWDSLFTQYIADQPGFSSDLDMFTLRDDILAGDIEVFMKKLKRIFALLPSKGEINLEQHYENNLTILFTLLGLIHGIEVPSVKGFSDMVVITDKDVYIFEFKIKGTPDEAIAQIREKGYATPYVGGPRQVYLIGAVFGKETRTLDAWEILPL